MPEDESAEVATEAIAEPEAEPEEVDDTVPCPACHQPVRLSLLPDKYASDVPAKFRARAARGTRGEA